MATRRKPKTYKTGGAVIADSELPIDVPPIEEPVEPDIPPASNESADAMMAALQAQRRAEAIQMQRAAEQAAPQPVPQPAPQPAPQMSERRQRFIAEHPELLDPRNAEAIESYWRQAQRMNISDEAEVDQYVLAGLNFERRHREPERREPEPVQASPEPAQARQEAFQEPAPRSEPVPRSERRSMPMAAPVSRSEAPSFNGKRTSSRGEMRLTEEERKIARDSIPDRPDAPKLTDTQKEFLYAQNKARYAQMRADGTYSEQRDR